MKVNIVINAVSFAHDDAGLKKGDRFEAVIKDNDVAKQKAIFRFRGVEHHAWIVNDPAIEQNRGLTYATILA